MLYLLGNMVLVGCYGGMTLSGCHWLACFRDQGALGCAQRLLCLLIMLFECRKELLDLLGRDRWLGRH